MLKSHAKVVAYWRVGVYFKFVLYGRLYQISSNKKAHFLFSKAILNVGRAKTATVDFATCIYPIVSH